MTVQNPPIFLQAGSHPAEDVRRHIAASTGDILRPTAAVDAMMDRGGVVGSDALEVTERGAGANMSVDVATGAAFIAGTEATYQGTYFVENRGVTNLTIAAADGSNPRHDLIVAKIEDSGYSGATDAWSLAVVTGTAAATPSFPAQPENSIVLAIVDVTAALGTISDANITDVRTGADTDDSATTTLGNYGLAPSPGRIVCVSDYRPQSPFTGMEIYETDTTKLYQVGIRSSSGRFRELH